MLDHSDTPPLFHALRSRPHRLLVLLTVLLYLTLAQVPALAQAEHQVYLPLAIDPAAGPLWWSTSAAVTLTPIPAAGVLSALDGQGRLHLLWHTRYAPQFIYHTYQTDSGWSPPTPVALTLGRSELLYPPLVDRAGALHLVWRNHLGYGIDNPYRLLVARFADDQWQSEELLWRGTTPGAAGIPHLAGEEVRVTAFDSTFMSGVNQWRRSEEGWVAAASIDPDHSVVRLWPDHMGGIHFFGWGSGTAYSYWREGAFLVHKPDIGVVVTARTLVMDRRGALHVSWRGTVPVPGGTVYGDYHHCLEADMDWREAEVLSGEYEASTPLSAVGVDTPMALAWSRTRPTPQTQVETWEGCERVLQAILPAQGAVAGLAIGGEPHKLCAVVATGSAATYQALCAALPAR